MSILEMIYSTEDVKVEKKDKSGIEELLYSRNVDFREDYVDSIRMAAPVELESKLMINQKVVWSVKAIKMCDVI